MMQKIQCYCDASFDERRRRAGWAAWIIGQDNYHRVSGVVGAEYVADSCASELAAIGNGLYYAVTLMGLQQGDEVTIVADNEHALGLLAGYQMVRPHRGADRRLLRAIKRFIARHGLELRLVHTKAHRNIQSAIDNGDLIRWVINDWCDKASKAELAVSLATEVLTDHVQSIPLAATAA